MIRRNVYWLIIVMASALSVACTRGDKKDSTKIRISAPQGKLGALVAVPGDRKPCFAVNVTAEDITGYAGDSCSPATGVLAGFAESGAPIQAIVRSGSKRNVALLMLLKASGDTSACPVLGTKIEAADLEHTYLIGEATNLSLSGPSQEVTIDAVFPGVEQNLAVQLGYSPSCIPGPVAPATPAVLAFSTAPSYDFGSHASGNTIHSLLTLTHSGGSTATALNAAALTAPFSFRGGAYPGSNGTCTATLASGSCTIEVSFSPASAGAFSDTLSLTYNDGFTTEGAAINLVGTGTAMAALSISDGATYDFGSQPLGSVTDKTFTVTNSGAVAATGISGAAFSGAYSFKNGSFPGTGGTCAASLASAASCTVVVSYAPASTGASSANLQLDYHDGNAVTSASRALTGTGLAHGPATQLIYSTQPANSAAGTGLTPIVEIRDAYGNLVTSGPDQNAVITLSLQAGAGTLTGVLSKNAVLGVATFSSGDSVTIGTVGAKTLRATKTDTTGSGGTAALTADSNSFTISHGAATQLTWSSQPVNNTVAGSAMAPVISLNDTYGNVVTSAAHNIILSINTQPGGATLSGTTVLALSGGVATWTGGHGLSLDKAGAYTLQASDGSLTADSVSFNIMHAAANHLTWSTQPANTVAGMDLLPVVQVRDAFENIVTSGAAASGNISLNIYIGPGGAVLSGVTSLAAVAGVATWIGADDLSLDRVGAYTLRASDGTRTADSASFNITHAAADHLVWSTAPADSTAGSDLVPVLEIRDAYDNVVTSGADSTANITVSINTGAVGATLGGTKVLAAVNGVATWTGVHDLNLDKVGAYTLAATDGTRSANSPSFNITHGPASHLTWSTQPSNTAAGEILEPVIEVRDAFDNIVTTGSESTAAIAITIESGPGTLMGTTTNAAVNGVAAWSPGHSLMLGNFGTYTLAASDGTRTAYSDSFYISHGAATHLEISSQPPSPVYSGAPIPFTVSVRDGFGNLVTNSAHTISLTMSSGTGTLNGTLVRAASGGVASFGSSGDAHILEAGLSKSLEASASGLSPAVTNNFDISAWRPTGYSGGAPIARRNHAAVWTGSKMLIYGGHDGVNKLNTGAAYDPLTDSWTTMPTLNAPTAADNFMSVWTGTQLFVWGGYGDNFLDTGAMYDPASGSGTWTPINTSGAPSARSGGTAVWTGTEVIVWGGSSGGTPQNSGARYNPGADTWTSMTASAAARSLHVAAWNGSKMLVWGGHDGTNYINSGGLYNPANDSWETTPPTGGAPSARQFTSAVATSTGEFIIFGGFSGSEFDNGAILTISNTWAAMSPAPNTRSKHTAIWDGSRMIVWGGLVAGSLQNVGYIYSPLGNSWTVTDTNYAPNPREMHSAVWTGQEMIIWGGLNVSTMDTGAVFRPPPP